MKFFVCNSSFRLCQCLYGCTICRFPITAIYGVSISSPPFILEDICMKKNLLGSRAGGCLNERVQQRFKLIQLIGDKGKILIETVFIGFDIGFVVDFVHVSAASGRQRNIIKRPHFHNTTSVRPCACAKKTVFQCLLRAQSCCRRCLKA